MSQADLVYISPEDQEYEPTNYFQSLLSNVGTTRTIYTYVLPTMTLEKVRPAKVNKILMQRYALVEKVKEAEVIGILIGTLVVPKYRETIEMLK
jgi:diphthamide biosynthesis enzyme Dph1/Dph2-like protein